MLIRLIQLYNINNINRKFKHEKWQRKCLNRVGFGRKLMQIVQRKTNNPKIYMGAATTHRNEPQNAIFEFCKNPCFWIVHEFFGYGQRVFPERLIRYVEYVRPSVRPKQGQFAPNSSIDPTKPKLFHRGHEEIPPPCDPPCSFSNLASYCGFGDLNLALTLPYFEAKKLAKKVLATSDGKVNLHAQKRRP